MKLSKVLLIVLSILGIICVFIVLQSTGCKKKVRIRPFSGVSIEKVICFESSTGKILWECRPDKITFCTELIDESVLGLGMFNGSDTKVVLKLYFECNTLFAKKACGVSSNGTLACCNIEEKFRGDALDRILSYIDP